MLINTTFPQNITITDDDSYTPDNSAILDIKSTDKGLLLPRLTNSEIASINNPPAGLIVYSTDENKPVYFDGNKWNTYAGNEIFYNDTIVVSDFDGNEYQTVQIGNQIWMTENLKTTHYADGTVLVDGTDSTNIDADYTTKYYFWYDDDSVCYAGTYGALYTWAAVMNGSASSNTNPSGVQGVCPAGWHLPSDAEWNELIDYLGGNGGKMKEAGYEHWNRPNTGATNQSRFTVIPGGQRAESGSYSELGNYTYFWSSTEYNGSSVWIYGLKYDNSGVFCYNYLGKDLGHSVRCLMD